MSPPLPAEIRCLIFDAEGVVIDTEGLWDDCQRVFFERHSLGAYDRAHWKPQLAGRSLIDGVRLIQASLPLRGDPEKLATERRAIMARLLNNAVDFVPGFRDCLRDLQAAGYRHSCVATSMHPLLFDVVDRRLGLRGLFGETAAGDSQKHGRIFFSADVRRAKPAPDVFLYAAQAMRVPPAECVVFEDSPGGIVGARAAGMHTIGIATSFAPEILREADHVIQDFAEIWRLPFFKQSAR